MIDISHDPLYVKGINETKLKDVESLIINTEFDDAYIAFLMAVSIDMVQQTRQRIAKAKIKTQD